MSRFFINRPIVAIVISLVTVIVGAISLTILPVSLFPEIVTPETVVTANYTGADARTVEQDRSLSPRESRARIRAAVEARYTAPATAPAVIPGTDASPRFADSSDVTRAR